MKNILSKEQIQLFLDAWEKKVGKKTLIYDLDGVVADFEPMAKFHADKLGVTTQEFKDRKLYRGIQGFYLDLDLISGAKDSIMQLDEFYDIIFVSAPSWGNTHCFTEKRLWIEKYFGKWAEKKMDLSFHKGHYMGHYLVDDRTKYGAGDFIGKHIMYGTEPFKTHAEVTKYLLANK
jgi:5'(3')-deoxyribonucleotidase